MTPRTPLYALCLLLSFAGCTCEYHASTRRGTSSGGERTASEWERERQRAEWERERRARHEREMARHREPRVVGDPSRPSRATGEPVRPPTQAPVAPPPGGAYSTPAARPAPSRPSVGGSMSSPTPPAPSPTMPSTGGSYSAPAPAPAPATPPEATPPAETPPDGTPPATPPADPGDNYVPARDPSDRPDATGQKPGSAGAPAGPPPRRAPKGSTLAPKR